MNAIGGLWVCLCVSFALVDQTGRQLSLLKVFPRALAVSVLLFRVAVCQNDFQDVPAITALNCSNITDFLEDSSALFEWINTTFTCDLTCVTDINGATLSFAPSPTSPLYSEAESVPFRITVSHRGEANMDCGMSCWDGNAGMYWSEGPWTSPPEPTMSFLSQTGITVGSTPSISATPPATEGTSKLLTLMPTYTTSPPVQQQQQPTSLLPTASAAAPPLENTPFSSQQSLNSVLIATPTPSVQPPEPMVPSVEQQKQASVVMVLQAVSLQQWDMDGGLLERKFKNATAAVATLFCRAHPAKCGFSGELYAAPRSKRSPDSILFTSADVMVLPGYPREVNDGDLEVAYSIRLRTGNHTGSSMLSSDMLLSAAIQFEQEMEEWMNVDEVAALSGALIPVGLAISVGIPATIIIIWRCRSYTKHKRRMRAEEGDVELTDIMDTREL